MRHKDRVLKAARYVWQAVWIVPAFMLLALAAVFVAVAFCSFKVGLTWFRDVR